MIKFNENYSINNSEGTIVFTQGKKGTVNANYEIKGKKDTGVINGILEGHLLKGNYHNKANNSTGLIEFIFNENGFDCRWKQGLEPGPMRGKWRGLLTSVQSTNNKETSQKNSTLITKEQKAAIENGFSSWDFEEDDENSEKLKKWFADKTFVLEAVREMGMYFAHASDELKADKEVVLEAVKKSGWVLEYASAVLKADKEVVFEAVRENAGALKYASEELKADKEVVLEAVKQSGWLLEQASDELKADKEVVTQAVKQAGGALRFASDELKTDKKLVLEAVKQDASALEYASKELKADKEVVMEAVRKDGSALEFASDELKREIGPVSVKIKLSGRIPKFFFGVLREEYRDEIKEALQYCSDDVQTENDFLNLVFALALEDSEDAQDALFNVISREDLENLPNFNELVNEFVEDGGNHFYMIDRLFDYPNMNQYGSNYGISFFEDNAQISISDMNSDEVLVEKTSLEEFISGGQDVIEAEEVEENSEEYENLKKLNALKDANPEFGFSQDNYFRWHKNEYGSVFLTDGLEYPELDEFSSSNSSDEQVTIHFDDIVTWSFYIDTKGEKFDMKNLTFVNMGRSDEFRDSENIVFSHLFYKNELVEPEEDWHRDKGITLMYGTSREYNTLDFFIKG
jgi:CxxC motif-containing protein